MNWSAELFQQSHLRRAQKNRKNFRCVVVYFSIPLFHVSFRCVDVVRCCHRRRHRCRLFLFCFFRYVRLWFFFLLIGRHQTTQLDTKLKSECYILYVYFIYWHVDRRRECTDESTEYNKKNTFIHFYWPFFYNFICFYFCEIRRVELWLQPLDSSNGKNST